MEYQCQCGLIAFPLPPDQKPLAHVICHCNKCRLISGSVFNISSIYPYFALPSSLTPSLSIHRHVGDSGNQIDKYFCKGCGNTVVHILVVKEAGQEKPPQWVSVSTPRIVGLDLKEVLNDKQITVHCWTREAVVPSSMWEGCRSWDVNPPVGNQAEKMDDKTEGT